MIPARSCAFAHKVLVAALAGSLVACNSTPVIPTIQNAVSSIQPAPAPPAEKPQVIDEPTAKKLLSASRKETMHPGIILRYSCQIPSTSSSFATAKQEEERAERLWDSQIAKELRLEAARDLQNSLYSDGRKIDVSVREKPYPKIIMKGVMFNATTAYVYAANGTDTSLGKKFLPLGVREIQYYGLEETSSNTWKAEDVHHKEFGDMEAVCQEVRWGKNPDTINATVENPK